MTTIASTRAACLFTAATIAFGCAGEALAQATPPSLLQLQGRLTDNAGQPISSAMRDLRVEFWDSALGGTSLGTSTVVDPSITNGIYAVSLTAPAGLFANNASVYMEMAVGNGAAGADGAFEVLSPRSRVLASGYALNADTLDGRDSSSFAQAANSFVQGGNAFGAVASLGTNDAFDVVLETGGAERARIDTAGAVSLQGNTITFANPFGSGTVGTVANASMTVTSSGAGTLFLEAGATGAMRLRTGGADRLYIENNGNVGIGTTGPAARLHVLNGSGVFARMGADAANWAEFRGDAGGRLLYLVPSANGAQVFQFRRADGSTTVLDVDTFNGRVGVNTSAPAASLDVYASGDAAFLRVFGTGDGDNFCGIDLRSDEATDKVWQLSHKVLPGELNKLITYYFDGAGWSARTAIDTAGNFGIGTTAPSLRLHIAGDARVGSLRDNAVSEPADWGDACVFSGGPVVWGGSGWGSENSDPLWMARFNVAPNQTELRLVVGDDPGQLEDKLVIGTMLGSGTFSKTATWGPIMTVSANGNVGIGTTTPGARLTVVAGATTDTLGANGASEGFDISEAISAADDVEVGDLVSADPATSQRVVRSRAPYDPALLGVITSQPAIAIGATDGNRHIALAGRVAVRVCRENGPIRRGDHLTSSSHPGIAMKATGAGRIVGVALGEFDGQGEGKVVVYVCPGWWDGGRTAELTQRVSELSSRLDRAERENEELRERLARLEAMVEAKLR